MSFAFIANMNRRPCAKIETMLRDKLQTTDTIENGHVNARCNDQTGLGRMCIAFVMFIMNEKKEIGRRVCRRKAGDRWK